MRKIIWNIDYGKHKKGSESQPSDEVADALVKLEIAKYVAKPKAKK